MPKVKLPKIYKVKKDKEEDRLIVKFKNLSKQQLKQFKADVDEYCQAYFKDKPEE